MSKAVMISIQPKWCEKIANGKKTIEVRKTKPKLETPFKCYIYCTQAKNKASVDGYTFFADELYIDHCSKTLTCGHTQFEEIVNGKVIGEFVCNFIYEFTEENQEFCGASFDAMQITAKELSDYANGKTVYGWHISDLIIYDKPKRISYFCLPCDKQPGCDCNYCKRHSGNKAIIRPPRNWCYVEECNGA